MNLNQHAVRLFAACGLAVLLAACASFKPAPPVVTIESVRLLEMGFSEQKFILLLRVGNPNQREFVLNKLSYQFDLSGQPFARGHFEQAVTLPALGEVMIEVPADMRIGDFLRSAAGKLLAGGGPAGRGEIDYRLSGSARIDDAWSAPFDRKGKIDLFKAAEASRR